MLLPVCFCFASLLKVLAATTDTAMYLEQVWTAAKTYTADIEVTAPGMLSWLYWVTIGRDFDGLDWSPRIGLRYITKIVRHMT